MVANVRKRKLEDRITAKRGKVLVIATEPEMGSVDQKPRQDGSVFVRTQSYVPNNKLINYGGSK